MAYFRPTVRGLQRLPYADDGSGSSAATLSLEGMAGNGQRSCTGWGGVPVLCPGPDAGVASFSLPLSSIPFNTSGDYFAILVTLNGPSLAGRNCHTPAGPADYVCAPTGDSLYDGTVDGSYVRALSTDPGYEALATDYHADTAQPGSSFVSHTAWPGDEVNGTYDAFDIAYLVNAVPVWPAPDVVGNNFGLALFEAAQLPASVDTTITYYSYDQPISGQLHVAVYVYNATDTPGDVLYGDVAGFV